MYITRTFKADVPDAERLDKLLQRLLKLNQAGINASRRAGDEAAVERCLQVRRKLTPNNLIRSLVMRALDSNYDEIELLASISNAGIKTGRPARAS